MATYGWLTKTAAITSLQSRLNNSSLWTSAELWLYISEGLRHFNGLCEQWNSTFNVANANGAWINTGTESGSPRLRSVTDLDLYTQMALMLLETVSAGTWTGSSQFNLYDLQDALQKRCQEVIQATSCNVAQLSPINATPGIRNGYALADTVLEPRRNRFMALKSQTTATGSSGSYTVSIASTTGIAVGEVMQASGVQSGSFVTGISGSTVTLSLPLTAALSSTASQFYQPWFLNLQDKLAFQAFDPDYLQTYGYPEGWAVSVEPPLSFDVDIAPTTPGYFDILALNSSSTFDPPAATLLGIPDDWSMVPMYGALADVLGMEAESTDRARAQYCFQRYQTMLEAMKKANWMTQALLNEAVANVVSLADMDSLAVDWQQSQDNLPAVVVAGPDFLAPVPGVNQLLSVNLVGNAPLLDSTGTYVQVSRDDWEAVLNYAHHVASFKMGNQMFAATMPMLNAFYEYCTRRNSRWATYGIFVEYLRDEGRKQERDDPREKK